MNINTATEKQITLIKRLGAEREGDTEQILAMGRLAWREGRLTKAVASQMIAALFEQPERQIVRAEVPEGMHQVDGAIFKVQRAVHGSGNLYAKRLTAASHPSASDGRCYCSDLQGVLCGVCREPGQTEWAFEYAPGAMRYLSEETRMTMEQAKQFGALYGACCVCGRTLTSEDSIKAGIGPICAGKFAA